MKWLAAAGAVVFGVGLTAVGHAPAAPPASCTAQWRAHGHTTQAAAKQFGRNCLVAQGAVLRTLTADQVMTKLTTIVDATHELARLEPADAASFCQSYGRMNAADRALMWRTMLTRMARQESAYKAAEPYWEVGQGQYSIGLLQLSLSDEPRYSCGLRTEVDLTDPDRNLACGARIMLTLVRRDGRIGGDTAHFAKGGAAYWSTLREVTASPDGAPPRDSRAAVIEATTALPSCKPK